MAIYHLAGGPSRRDAHSELCGGFRRGPSGSKLCPSPSEAHPVTPSECQLAPTLWPSAASAASQGSEALAVLQGGTIEQQYLGTWGGSPSRQHPGKSQCRRSAPPHLARSSIAASGKRAARPAGRMSASRCASWCGAYVALCHICLQRLALPVALLHVRHNKKACVEHRMRYTTPAVNRARLRFDEGCDKTPEVRPQPDRRGASALWTWGRGGGMRGSRRQ